MEKIILTGIFVLLTVSFAWGGITLNKRAKKRGEQPGCMCLLCFLAAAGFSLFVVKEILEAAPMEFAGLFFGSIGVLFWRSHRFFKRAIIVRGVVTGWSTRQEEHWQQFRAQASLMEKKLPEQCPKNLGAGKPLYAPVVAFEFDGQSRQVTGTMWTSSKPKIGSVMKVGVDPQNIQDARVLQKSEWLLGGLFLLVGITFFCAGLYARF